MEGQEDHNKQDPIGHGKGLNKGTSQLRGIPVGNKSEIQYNSTIK